MNAYEDEIIRKILQLIEVKKEADVPDFIDAQFNAMLLPDWYKAQVLNNIHNRLKEIQGNGYKQINPEKIKIVITAIENKFGTTLLKF